eukprot:m.30782 g.30782  ORF g.30782 m.30782 type:complete len:95 (-) comp8238_c0_seq1:104-388(-)
MLQTLLSKYSDKLYKIYFFQRGMAAITQVGGTLAVSESEFTDHKPSPKHFSIGPNASKTIITTNIITGILDIEKDKDFKGKLIVSLNADDSKDD